MSNKTEDIDDIIKHRLRKFTENNLYRSSAEHWLETGKVSGSFRSSLHGMIEDYAGRKCMGMNQTIELLDQHNNRLLEENERLKKGDFRGELITAQEEKWKLNATIKELVEGIELNIKRLSDPNCETSSVIHGLKARQYPDCTNGSTP